MATVLPVDMIESRTVRTEYDDSGQVARVRTGDVRTVLASVTDVGPLDYHRGREGKQRGRGARVDHVQPLE